MLGQLVVVLVPVAAWTHSPFSSVGVSSSVSPLYSSSSSLISPLRGKKVFRPTLWDQFTEESKKMIIDSLDIMNQTGTLFSGVPTCLKAQGKSVWLWGLRRKLHTRICSTDLCSSSDHIIKVLDYRRGLTLKVKNNSTYGAKRDAMWEGGQNFVGTRGV